MNSTVVINKSFFNNNTAYRDSGGAIYAYNSNITVDSSEFSNNTVTRGYYYSSQTGGAIYIYNRNRDFELQINDTVLSGNRAYQGHGGAIHVYIVYSSNRYENVRYIHHLQMHNTQMYGNIADQGGIIYVHTYSDFQYGSVLSTVHN